MEFDREKICNAYNEKWEKRKKRKEQNCQIGKNQNAWREGKLQVLESGHHITKQAKMKKKKKEKIWERKH